MNGMCHFIISVCVVAVEVNCATFIIWVFTAWPNTRWQQYFVICLSEHELFF